MSTWALLKTFALPLTIFIVRNGYSYYKSIKQTYALRKPQIRPVPQRASRALNILFLTSLAFLIYTLPYFAPPNIFTATSTRLQTSTNLIFSRLAALPTHQQAPFDADLTALKEKLTSTSTRLIYFAFGPTAVLSCPFCSPKDPTSYLLYTLPTLLTPHILHLTALGLATSKSHCGPQAARWRTHALVAAISLAAYDIYALATYPLHENRHARRAHPAAIDFFHWRARTTRGLAIAALDLALAAALYLAATNRFFVRPTTIAERAGRLAEVLQGSNFRLWGAGNVRNAVLRDDEAARGVMEYWALERGVYEEAEVVAALRGAIGRVNMRELEGAAEQRAKDVVAALDMVTDWSAGGDDEGNGNDEGEEGADGAAVEMEIAGEEEWVG